MEAAVVLHNSPNYVLTPQKGKSGKKRPTAAMLAKIEGHVWSFDELFRAALGG